MVPTETSASSCDDSLKLKQMKIVTHTRFVESGRIIKYKKMIESNKKRLS